MKTVLYFHGFLSSPASQKVQVLREALQGCEHAYPFTLIAPNMNQAPRDVEAMLTEYAQTLNLSETVVIGSSLGGFWATRFMQRYHTPGVLLNPCLVPWDFISLYVGRQKVYGREEYFDVKPEYEADFVALNAEVPARVPQPGRTLTLISMCDEVLPWEMTFKHSEGSVRVMLPESDHQISDFARVVSMVVDFIHERTLPVADLSGITGRFSPTR